VNAIRKIQIGAVALAIGLMLTTAAQAGSNAPALRALAIRGQALNAKYNLDALNALRIRGDALNRRYHLGAYATTDNAAATRALRIEGQAMNQRYHLGSYAVVRQSSTGFDWADAVVGGAVVFGLFLVGGGVAVGARRLRGERLTPA
jgi:hypothetical protein